MQVAVLQTRSLCKCGGAYAALAWAATALPAAPGNAVPGQPATRFFLQPLKTRIFG